MIHRETHRILIWGKTYPELSARYTQTVCTGGILEDGRPVRLYPIPYRYLDGEQRFKNYQWIRAEITRDIRDPRPESHRIEGGTIICEDSIETSPDEWGKRAEFMFRNQAWQFPSVEALRERERLDRTSLGTVEPAEIIEVTIKERTEDEKQTFNEKLERLRKEGEARQQ
jgi:hypothetical protein